MVRSVLLVAFLLLVVAFSEANEACNGNAGKKFDSSLDCMLKCPFPECSCSYSAPYVCSVNPFYTTRTTTRYQDRFITPPPQSSFGSENLIILLFSPIIVIGALLFFICVVYQKCRNQSVHPVASVRPTTTRTRYATTVLRLTAVPDSGASLNRARAPPQEPAPAYDPCPSYTMIRMDSESPPAYETVVINPAVN